MRIVYVTQRLPYGNGETFIVPEIEALIDAGARGIVTCDTIAHATNQICITDPLADAVRERLA